MREVEIHYFVPENLTELEQLVGKSVGVSSINSVTAQPLPDVTPMVLGDDPRVWDYEFLVQAKDNSTGRLKPKRKILAFVVSNDSLVIDQEGVLLYPGKYESVSYTPKSRGYKRRLELLRRNDSWREPR